MKALPSWPNHLPGPASKHHTADQVTTYEVGGETQNSLHSACLDLCIYPYTQIYTYLYLKKGKAVIQNISRDVSAMVELIMIFNCFLFAYFQYLIFV